MIVIIHFLIHFPPERHDNYKSKGENSNWLVKEQIKKQKSLQVQRKTNLILTCICAGPWKTIGYFEDVSDEEKNPNSTLSRTKSGCSGSDVVNYSNVQQVPFTSSHKALLQIRYFSNIDSKQPLVTSISLLQTYRIFTTGGAILYSSATKAKVGYFVFGFIIKSNAIWLHLRWIFGMEMDLSLLMCSLKC